MSATAFHSPALPLRTCAPLPQRTRTSPRRAPRASALRTRLAERARADIALLQAFAGTAAKGGAAVAAAAAISLATLPALADVPTSAPPNGLFDEAGVVTKGTSQLFDKAAGNILRDDGVNVRFVLVRALPYNETPNEYANELAKEWGLGERDLLFVASPKLARAGVYVGSRAGERISEGVALSIAEETYGVPAGDERYGSAVLAVSNRLIPVLKGEQDPGPPDMSTREVGQTYKTKKETSAERSKYVTVVVVILVISVLAPLLQTYWYVRDD